MSRHRATTALTQIRSVASKGVPGNLLKRLLVETAGSDLVEYALLTAFIGFAGAAAWNAVQTGLGNAYIGFNTAVWNLWEPADPVGGGS
jgi:Flp pilus assembly pilin Flp